jgi:hypothetical protein
MERFTHSMKILWRTERLLTERQLQLASQRLQFNALAGLIALFGLGMMSIAAYFALVPTLGQAGAAFAVGCADFALAGLLFLYAKSLQPAPEIAMVREMRDMALSDLQEEISLAQAEVVAVQKEVRRFIRHPVDALMPDALGSVLNGAVNLLTRRKK